MHFLNFLFGNGYRFTRSQYRKEFPNLLPSFPSWFFHCTGLEIGLASSSATRVAQTLESGKCGVEMREERGTKAPWEDQKRELEMLMGQGERRMEGRGWGKGGSKAMSGLSIGENSPRLRGEGSGGRVGYTEGEITEKCRLETESGDMRQKGSQGRREVPFAGEWQEL